VAEDRKPGDGRRGGAHTHRAGRGTGRGRSVPRPPAKPVPKSGASASREQRVAPPGLDRQSDEPPIPEDVDTRALHRAVRAELRGLPKELAEIVASHLVVAGQLVDSDPDLAHAHAEAAKRRAARLPIVREAVAETAYASGRFDVALQEFRALRRMTGTQDFLPVMADCERALGRPQAALKLAEESYRHGIDPALQIEMIIVAAGARADLGQHAESLRLLAAAVERYSVDGDRLRLARSRLCYAYAEALLRADRRQDARRAFASAAALDPDQQTDAAERVDELDGIVIDYDEADELSDDRSTGDGSGATGEPA
jgi:tetratricopeptide (TPR) repeat protein